MHYNSRSTAKTELENMLAEGWDLKNSVSSLKSMDLLSKPDNKKDSKTNEILLTYQETLAPGE